MSKLVPKLRFKEFSGEWEEKAILNIASMKARIGWQNLRQDEHLDKGEYYLITGTDFRDGIIDWGNAKYVEYDRYAQDKHIILKEGDILITKDGSIGKLAYVENIKEKKATLNNGIFRIRIKDNNTKFIYYTFLSLQFKKFLEKLSAGSSINHLYQKDFKTYKIILPISPKEQQKIANTLSSLDSLIEAQQRKVEALKKHKKGLMQQLFPAEGANVPKLRFKEFSGEWEEKKFEKVFDRIPSKKYQIKSSEYLVKGKHPVIDQGKSKIIAYSNNTNKLFKNDGIIVFGDHTRILKYIDFNFIVGADGTQLIKTKENFNSRFFYYQILKNKIPNTGYNRHFKFIKDMLFVVPSEKEKQEQEKIANTLSSLDNLIGAHQRKVEALKKHKKALMQQMFVSGEG